MTGKLTAAMIHGRVLSILFALANSMAPADHGLVKTADNFPDVVALLALLRSRGETKGEENDKR
jgi:hypothetical protein